MSEIIAVDGILEGFSVRGTATVVPKGDYRVEQGSDPGDRLLLLSLTEKGHFQVPVNTLKTAKALGRIRFVQEKQPLTSLSNSLDESVNRMLAGGSIADEIAVQETKEIPPGLLGWVNDFKIMRQNGNINGAKEIKKKIDKEIKRLKLTPADVFGTDPTPD